WARTTTIPIQPTKPTGGPSMPGFAPPDTLTRCLTSIRLCATQASPTVCVLPTTVATICTPRQPDTAPWANPFHFRCSRAECVEIFRFFSEIRYNFGLPMNIKEVARLAKVSTATVSRTINGSDKVTAETAARVRRAIETLKYYPNTNARALGSGRSSLYGLIISDITNPF